MERENKYNGKPWAIVTTPASIEAGHIVNTKKVQHLLVDSLIGKKVMLFKKEYSENDYDEHDSRPKYHYDTFFHGDGVIVVICEIMGVKISTNKDQRIRLILSDNGMFADLKGLYLDSELNFV